MFFIIKAAAKKMNDLIKSGNLRLTTDCFTANSYYSYLERVFITDKKKFIDDDL